VLIDSGSGSNLISKDTLQQLKYQGLKIEFKPCTKRFYAYGGQELGAEGQFQSQGSISKTKVVANFTVVVQLLFAGIFDCHRSWNPLFGSHGNSRDS